MDMRNNLQLQKFVQLFLEKNEVINLSAIRDEEEVWGKHIEDSLIVVPLLQDYLQGRMTTLPTGRQDDEGRMRVLDLGTGGGFPGIPLAILFPDCHFTLLDARRKKIDCIREFVEQLGLPNVTPQWGRAEDCKGQFDLVVSRATAYITDLLTWIKPLLKPNGRAWLYKMASEEEWNDGIQMAKKMGFTLERVLYYTLAGQERWIVEIRRKLFNK